MYIQRLIMPIPEMSDCSKLYYRADKEVTSKAREYLEGKHVTLKEGGRLSFDTFWNALAVEKLSRYLEVKAWELELTVIGHWQVNVYESKCLGVEDTPLRTRADIRSDCEKLPVEEERICSREVVCEKKKTITISLPRTGRGMWSVELVGVSGEVTWFSGSWRAKTKAERPVTLAIDICTYRREEYVKRNIECLIRYVEEQKADVDIFLIDNGKTLHPEPNAHLFYYPNKNLGGAGGFTRGLIEIRNAKKVYTHTLIMDDDVLLDTEVVDRTISLLGSLREEYREASIGGSLIPLFQPTKFSAKNESWVRGFVQSVRRHYHIESYEDCVELEVERSTNYSGWWYCCISRDKFMKELPMPCFIHGDDIEYGLRISGKWIELNAIAVWHEDLESKYNSALQYYDLRNWLLVNLLRVEGYSAKEAVGYAFNFLCRSLCAYRYLEARYLFQAMNDVLKGWKWFANLDAEEQHERIRSLPGYQLADPEELDFDVTNCQREPYVSRQMTFRRELTVNGFLLPAKGDFLYNTLEYHCGQCYRMKRVLNYFPLIHKGFVTEKKCLREIGILVHFLVKALVMFIRWPWVARGYARHFAEITSEEQWRERLGLEERT